MTLLYGNGEESFSNENIMYCSDNQLLKFDYLLMVDSRGLVTDINLVNSSYLYLLKTMFNELNISYLMISRPKNLTTLSTLYNFLKLNPNLKFDNLITNLGFVDCTPKKQENIDDMILQLNQFSKISYKINEYEGYKLNSGNSERLKSIEYSMNYLIEMNNFFSEKFKKTFFINTPIISESIKIERERPKSFFKQIAKTNILIDNIVALNKSKNILIDIEKLNFTYDGVHYTSEGHKKIFHKIKESILK